jgi:N-acetylmuramoyl-L-alanine amidase
VNASSTEIIEALSPNYDERRPHAPIDILLLHYTGMQSGAAALERMTDPAAKVSAHYMIEEDGTIYRLVAEAHRAWHAGQSFWAGERDINSRSIGIELVNPGHEWGYRPFPTPQMQALLGLATELLARHSIPPERVLGHSDVVANPRRTDPGELFDWQLLAKHRIGLWPQVTEADRVKQDAVYLLARYGYLTGDAAQDHHSFTAFQRHFRPQAITGEVDTETTALLAALCRQAGL